MKRRLRKEEEIKIQHIKENPLCYPSVRLVSSFHCFTLFCNFITHGGFFICVLCLKPPIPSLPLTNPTMSTQRRVRAIQRYISALQYNYSGQSFVALRRDKGMKHLIFAAKTLIRECLPIQCVEGLFLAVFFTNGLEVCILLSK